MPRLLRPAGHRLTHNLFGGGIPPLFERWEGEIYWTVVAGEEARGREAAADCTLVVIGAGDL